MTINLIDIVKNAVEEISPLSNALQDWDNVGILVRSKCQKSKKILITVDFTLPVLEECISKNIKTVICYHPVIFTKIKNIDCEFNVLHGIIKNEISVFCPHTSLDKLMNSYYFIEIFKNYKFDQFFYDGLVCFADNETSIDALLNEIRNSFGLKVIKVAYGYSHNENTKPQKVYVGVGAGFEYVNYSDSIIITGEMTHHQILNAISRRCTVVLLEHCRSERIFMKELKSKLEKKLSEFEIFISEVDKCPIDYVIK